MKLQIKLDDTDVLKFKELGKLFPDAVKNGMRALVLALTRYTIQKKFENQGPRYLNRQTGTAIRSIVASAAVEVTGSLITGRWGSNLDYVKKHEEGGTFTESVRAHSRKAVQRNVRVGGSQIATGVVFVPGHTTKGGKVVPGHYRRFSPRNKFRGGRVIAHGFASVGQFTRTRTYRARHMFLDSFGEKQKVMGVPLRRSVELLITNAKVPSVGALGDLI